jgi:hypothetical protein
MMSSDVMHACMAVIRRWQLYMIDDDGLLVLVTSDVFCLDLAYCCQLGNHQAASGSARPSGE